ncbi:EXS_family protein [Hexamita inflata]|uniref:EXS family protein n=1 Tax=Hexamita inflata TaxID=28002 RepID=A0AA86VL87_9EUKA|nr:EXS family protein [Hexamita inflata]
MIFGEMFNKEIIPEWRSKYVNYNKLRQIIHEIQHIQSNIKENQNDQLIELEMYDQHLWTQIVTDLQNMNQFYEHQMNKMQTMSNNTVALSQELLNDKKQIVTIKNNMFEEYKSLIMLENYLLLNIQALNKIVRDRDNSTQYLFNGQEKLQTLLNEYKNLMNGQQIVAEKLLLENSYSLVFKVSQQQAKQQLIQYVTPEKDTFAYCQKSSTKFGLSVGFQCMFAIYSLYVIIFPLLNKGYSSVFYNHVLLVKFIRLQFCLCFFSVILGYNTRIYEKRQINYIFIFEICPSKVIASYRTHVRLCLNYVCMLSVSTILAIVKLHQLSDHYNELPPLIFKQLTIALASCLPLWLIVAFPVSVLFLYVVVQSCYWNKIQNGIFKYIVTILGKQCLPWKFNVTFPVFFFGDQFTSISVLFADMCQLLCRQQFDWLMCIAFNVPSLVRVIQSVKRYYEAKQAYPHLVNAAKLSSAFFSSCMYLNVVRTHKWLLNLVIIGRVYETSFKIYWDIIEDWALLSGGLGARVFKSKPHTWQNKYICRRPSAFKTHIQVFAIINNVLLRSLWIFSFYSTHLFTKTFWFQTFSIFLEITRKCIWNALRMDNQQATNCEDFANTRFIPVTLSLNERARLKHKMEEINEFKGRRMSLVRRTDKLLGQMQPVKQSMKVIVDYQTVELMKHSQVTLDSGL